MNAPQVIMIVLWTLTFTITLYKHGEPDNYNFFSAAIGIVLQAGLLWWGGFFG